MKARGFSLIEVVVAVVLTGMVLAIAAGFVGALGPIAGVAEAAGLDAARRGNGHATLRELVVSMDLGIHGSGTFVGTPDRSEFSAWVPDAFAGARPVNVLITVTGDLVDVRAGSLGFVVEFENAVTVQYFSGGAWRSEWASGTTLPSAIRLVTSADTSTYWIGRRG